ncbi:hypothetical protein RJT34_04219 [Clitoria ternatea]|uniref:Uncharacterized protein n=1 Tax=Clitoria ternatea TaxID=43366 RepID=A0AAN9KNQ3_CLITE
MASNIQQEWIIAGDFKDISCQGGKKGGLTVNQAKCDLLFERLNKCKLVDLAFVWPRFTWRGAMFKNQNRILERLDKAYCNTAWRSLYAESELKILPRVVYLTIILLDYNCGLTNLGRSRDHLDSTELGSLIHLYKSLWNLAGKRRNLLQST